MRFTIWLTNEEYETAKIKAQALGFATLSAFARQGLLKDNAITEIKIKEIYRRILTQNGKEQENSSKDKPFTKSAY